ncbi:hypothetical protein L208DRAFT_1383622 [Tricholoma matsutake]|nr:hypothetical protein L208DRAFT_1383622 [Tricholoma matsutake 945]
MRLFSIFAVIAATVAVVCAANIERDTNAARFARGLPPLPPRNLFTPSAAAKRGSPSGYPVCSSGYALCCDTVVLAGDPVASLIIGLLGIHISADVTVGLTCSPISSGTSCSRHPVCCQNNSYGDVIALVCVDLTVGL